MAERPALRHQRTGDQRPERHQSAHLRDRGVLCELPRTLTLRGRQPMATSSPQGLSRWPVQAWSSVLSSCISTRWPCSSDSWCPGFPSARRVENRRVRHGCWICSSCFPPQSVWVSYGSHICARSPSVVDERKAGQEYRGRPEGDRSRQSPVRRSGERCGLLLLRGRTRRLLAPSLLSG
jgi:hypothetical protein